MIMMIGLHSVDVISFGVEAIRRTPTNIGLDWIAFMELRPSFLIYFTEKIYSQWLKMSQKMDNLKLIQFIHPYLLHW